MALKQVAQVTATVQQVVALRPQVRKKLMMELTAYQSLKNELDAITAAMNVRKGAISKLRAETGETALEIEGFKITHVTPTRKTLNHEKLIELGCAVAWIEEATENKPTKAYDKVSCPGSTED